MRKTKIICTLGPAVDSDEMIEDLIKAGMDCARFNFSHGDHAEQKNRIKRVRKVCGKLKMPVAMLLDTKGPEIRLKDFESGKVTLTEGQEFTLDKDQDIPGNEKRCGISYPELCGCVTQGTKILIDDGKIAMEVKKTTKDSIVCTVQNGGEVSNHKSLNVPDVSIPMDFISPSDRSDLLFGIEEGVDFVAASFTRRADDVLAVRKLLDENGGNKIKIISKIENKEGIENLQEIVDVSDGIMVARGDMGVELEYQMVPAIQKRIISACNAAGKIAVTATQMLDSMISNPRPTRAEVSDVANAVYDETTAIMLSGETASGRYPVEAVTAMAKIAEETEKSINYNTTTRRNACMVAKDRGTVLCKSATVAAMELDAKAIVVKTMSGYTARVVSEFRPSCPIIALTVDAVGRDQLKLAWGVKPYPSVMISDADELFADAIDKVLSEKILKKGDIVVIIAGTGTDGVSDTMRIVQL